MKFPKIKITEHNSGQTHSFDLEEALQFIYDNVNKHTNYSYWCLKTTCILALIQTFFLIGFLSYTYIGPYVIKLTH